MHAGFVLPMFGAIEAERVLAVDELFAVVRDKYPVTPGHTLIIPRRAVARFRELTSAEKARLLTWVDWAQSHCTEALTPSPDGFNLGINDGPSAGQTMPQFHFHVIPRRTGDVPDPRGGVRWVIPERAQYWQPLRANRTETMITTDITRGRKLAELLHSAFATNGIHGRNKMPEDLPPTGVERGSLEHVLFITLTVAIDYQRDALALWDSSRRSFADPETAYLFQPARLHETPWQQVRKDMQKHKLSKKPGQDCNTWRTVSITFLKQWGGDPKNFLTDCGWDAPTILERLKAGTHLNNGRPVPDFPFLRGKKIGPLWLRMLRDNAGYSIRNLEAVPIPVDVHVARASLAIGLIRGHYEGGVDGIYQEIRRAWRESVKGLMVDGREMIALDVDEPLWHLSKYGCTDRDAETGICRHLERCDAREFCLRGSLNVSAARVVMHI